MSLLRLSSNMGTVFPRSGLLSRGRLVLIYPLLVSFAVFLLIACLAPGFSVDLYLPLRLVCRVFYAQLTRPSVASTG
jgi:hypothetical protein